MTIRKPARLLLVDDDPGLLKLLGMRLVSEGYSVVTAGERAGSAARAGA
ncbi:sensory histidine kinase YfhA [Klebsiella pneumoniae subsp. rhinoscleromatis]|nr:sensory histidine kinase YfhA [Klebsiella pneumoniae subsp. rhinoscleromatis]